MGKPRMIILVRHAQSEGNKNRDIHQFIPDHRVQLTAEGHSQAEEAGCRLRSLLRPDDTLHFFTSPYRRTRETTEGMLKGLTSDDPTPSPWKRSTIQVYEEPRLREQDFGNFQPCSAEMERMWQERADYGHFFYRIPNGESAADAYDRVSGFNESLWRQFGEETFPSVCVLVTHGLMTRVFLMKWYHWSVEYFEDLRNMNHCEFIIMKQHPENGKYVLQNQLRTWSDLKRRASASASSTSIAGSQRANPLNTPAPGNQNVPTKRWGGCVNGCNHGHVNFPRRTKRMNTYDFSNLSGLVNGNSDAIDPLVKSPGSEKYPSSEKQAKPEISLQASPSATTAIGVTSSRPRLLSPTSVVSSATNDTIESLVISPTSASRDGDDDLSSSESEHLHLHAIELANRGRDFGGSLSGVATPVEGVSDDSDYVSHLPQITSVPGLVPIKEKQVSKRRQPVRKLSHAEWEEKSGMGYGARADTLGDGADDEDDSACELKTTNNTEEGIVGQVVDAMKEKSRKTFDEVY